MQSKTIGIRLPDNLIAALKADGDKLNTTVVERLQNSLSDERAARLDIKGIFTDSEQQAIAQALAGVAFDNSLLYSAELVIGHFEASSAAFAEAGADLQAVCEKVSRLTRIQLATVLRIATSAK